jgi:hypothetical protein
MAAVKARVRAASARLSLAGIGLGFKSDSAGIISVLRSRYSSFQSKSSADFTFTVFEKAGCQTPFRPAVKLESGVLCIGRGDFKARLDLKTGRGELAAAPTGQCLDAFLRSFISFQLLRRGGFMLHSAGLLKKGRVYLFPGKSGAGKSTLSKLAAAAGAELVSDEINLVLAGKGGWRVHGSPFWGEMRADGRQGSWPLGGLCLLQKARVNRISSCGPREALPLLLRCLVNFDRSPAAGSLALKNSAALLAGVAFRRLEFSKTDSGFLELL